MHTTLPTLTYAPPSGRVRQLNYLNAIAATAVYCCTFAVPVYLVRNTQERERDCCYKIGPSMVEEVALVRPYECAST